MDHREWNSETVAQRVDSFRCVKFFCPESFNYLQEMNAISVIIIPCTMFVDCSLKVNLMFHPLFAFFKPNYQQCGQKTKVSSKLKLGFFSNLSHECEEK